MFYLTITLIKQEETVHRSETKQGGNLAGFGSDPCEKLDPDPTDNKTRVQKDPLQPHLGQNSRRKYL